MGETGKLAGRYRLLNPLGGGELLLAFDEQEHRDVVVRRLRVPAESREPAVAEARRAVGLTHACVVPLLDVLVEGGEAWLVMEFVSGSSLEQSVRARRPLPVLQAARVGVHLLSALEATHAAGIVHGRVNPANVLLTSTGRALLTGFGLPALGMRPSADMWSLAATLHFAVEGRPPGQAPAEGTEPLRSLVRAMLRPSDTPPVRTIAETLRRLAMDRSLDQVVAAGGPLPPAEVAAIGLAVLEQLAEPHARGEHHGGVQPGSVLINEWGHATLVPRLAPAQLPAFTPPEGAGSPVADLWSLGATLFAAVQGRPPAPGAPLSRAGALAPVLFDLLSGDPGRRPAADVLRRRLVGVLEHNG
jgi:serine/threonine protein kinase